MGRRGGGEGDGENLVKVSPWLLPPRGTSPPPVPIIPAPITQFIKLQHAPNIPLPLLELALTLLCTLLLSLRSLLVEISVVSSIFEHSERFGGMMYVLTVYCEHFMSEICVYGIFRR